MDLSDIKLFIPEIPQRTRSGHTKMNDQKFTLPHRGLYADRFEDG